MADLYSTLKRAGYHPFRQTVGRTTKARGVGIGRNTVIKPHELGPWLKAVENLASDWGDYFLFLLLTGLRREEALGLRWADVDFVGRTFIVRDTKNHRDHELPISTAALAILLQQGIGNTIRVSLTPEPNESRTKEVVVAQEILQTMGIRSFTPLVTACPGCGPGG